MFLTSKLHEFERIHSSSRDSRPAEINRTLADNLGINDSNSHFVIGFHNSNESNNNISGGSLAAIVFRQLTMLMVEKGFAMSRDISLVQLLRSYSFLAMS